MEGEGIPERSKTYVFVAFWHPPGSGLWAPGHIDFGDGHVCPSTDLYPSKNLWFSIGFYGFGQRSRGARTLAEP